MGISYNNVKEIALSRGIKSDNALCRICGIPYGTFNDWKCGKTKTLSEQNILKLASGLSISVDDLINSEKPKALYGAIRRADVRVNENIPADFSEDDKELFNLMKKYNERPELRIVFHELDETSQDQALQIIDMIQKFKRESR